MNKQLKILKMIYRKSPFDYSAQSQEVIDIIKYLNHRGFVDCKEEYSKYGEPTGNKSCSITQTGIHHLHEIRQNTIYWLIPNILSFIAIIISFIALAA